MVAPRIHKLEELVINKIAAGEVIQRPANALKELLENSLDAGATQIQITCREGGLKLLQIQDNGHGIMREDMPLVCERFATSKLREFDDLRSLTTFGFRGEALASISHVAHVVITSKTAQEPCAYRGEYRDGKLMGDLKPCAGNQGTTIVIEDMFATMPLRKQALRSPSEEYSRILDVVTKYAVHRAGIAFNCKKHGTNQVDLSTSSLTCTPKDVMRSIYGSTLARELVDCQTTNLSLGLTRMAACISKANYSVKKGIFLLFINHRLVDCPLLKKSIDALYAMFLPKQSYSAVYMSIDILPHHVDVNVHPTKQQVRFLHEDRLISFICEELASCLSASNQSRSFKIQSITLPTDNDEDNHTMTATSLTTPASLENTSPLMTTKREPPVSSQSSDSFSSTPSLLPSTSLTEKAHAIHHAMKHYPNKDTPLVSPKPSSLSSQSSISTHVQQTLLGHPLSPTASWSSSSSMAPPPSKMIRVDHRLQTLDDLAHKRKSRDVGQDSSDQSAIARPSCLETLLDEVGRRQHHGLTEVFQQHTMVGLMDDQSALIQHATRLYLVQYSLASVSLCYQLVLRQIGCFGTLQLNPIVIREALRAYMTACRRVSLSAEVESKEETLLADRLLATLMRQSRMLKTYFNIGVEDGELRCLPLLLPDYKPRLLSERLPIFLYRLATVIDYDYEQPCIEGIAHLLAWLYQVKRDRRPVSETAAREGKEEEKHEEETDDSQDNEWRFLIEHRLFPAFRKYFVAPQSLIHNKEIIQLADLPDLYRVFERC